MSGRDEVRVCGVCGRTLEHWEKGGVAYYRHNQILDADADHPPVAVRYSDAAQQARPRCDFCTTEPVTHTMVVDRETLSLGGAMTYDKEWAMCAACTTLALAGDWVGLRRRAFQHYEERHGPLSESTKIEWRLLMRELKAGLVMYYAEEYVQPA